MTLLDAENRGGQVGAIPGVLWLTDERAVVPDLVGAKAANLARAASMGHPVLPGFVITTEGTPTWNSSDASDGSDAAPTLRDAWRDLSRDGELALVVRSSSTIEDADESSQAGRFASILRVRGWSDFTRAVRDVLASADAAGTDAPMAVLVQTWLEAEAGGVAFGRDPVTGADGIVVSAVSGGPHTLVSGDEQGTTLHLSRHGRVHHAPDAPPRSSDASTTEASVRLSRRSRHDLARLVDSLGRSFGGPQDVEWAIDPSDHLWLLQNRPITAGGEVAAGPVFGPGPIAETFPEQLAPIEEDLWVQPLRDGIATALVLSGIRRRSEIDRSRVVASVSGRLAVDLDLIGAAPSRRRWWRALDPRPGARRVSAAWRVGRLRASLPKLADNLLRDTDESLLDVPVFDELSDEQLVLILRNAAPILQALHGYEVLMGMLLPAASAPSIATQAIADARRGRSRGLSDAEIISEYPVTLALVPPRVGSIPPLPSIEGDNTFDRPELDADHRDELLRESLRLRIRWVHELTARATWELAQRLQEGHRLHDARCVRHLRLEELDRLAQGATAPTALRDRLLPDAPPLPAAFRFRADGGIAAVGVDSVAIGAGGGRAQGAVYMGDDPPPGAVLVVDNLSPRLAAVLPQLSGIIAETGSPLSHVAILARELGIATVVAYPDARRAFTSGDYVVVDGATGEVTKANIDTATPVGTGGPR